MEIIEKLRKDLEEWLEKENSQKEK
jgi:hypothetical protein